MAGAPIKEEQYRTAAKSYNDAFEFLQENHLLIPLDIFVEADGFLREAKSIINEFNSGERRLQRGHHEAEHEDHTAKAQAHLSAMEPKYERIHETMQAYLGFAV